MNLDTMPYAPGGESMLGHNQDFRFDRLGLLHKLSCLDEPIMRLRLPFPGVNGVVLNDPDLIQEMMVEKGRSFDKSAMLRFALYPLAGEGLFTSNGELWQRQRKLMASLFHPRSLDGYAPDMIACAERTVDRWRDGQELTLLAETTRLTMSVAGKTLFDADTFTEADEIGHALTVALDWTGWMMGRPFAIAHVVIKRRLEAVATGAPAWLRPRLEATLPRLNGPLVLVGARGRELARAIALLDQRVQTMIETRRAEPKGRTDLLARLLEVRDEDGGRMSDRQVRDEVLTLFVAGHETTSTGLAWAIYLAARHPDVYAKLEREVDALGGPPRLEDLPQLGYCLRVFREALRLHPPVYLFGRDSVGDVSIAGYRLPPQTNVLVSPWALHRRAALWPDPERFDPDRFLPEREASRHRYAYLPFGAGPRICIGMQFAYMEAQLALAVMLRRYRFESLEEDEAEPSATLRPKRGVRVRVIRR